jgi:hypothetical protein
MIDDSLKTHWQMCRALRIEQREIFFCYFRDTKKHHEIRSKMSKNKPKPWEIKALTFVTEMQNIEID